MTLKKRADLSKEPSHRLDSSTENPGDGDHGDADTLVPLDQPQRFQAEAHKLGCRVELVIHQGGGHGWWSMVWDIRQFADWFDQHVRQ